MFLADGFYQRTGSYKDASQIISDLRFLTASFEYEEHEEVDVEPQHCFLSKLTGVLAFRKMVKNGIAVGFVCPDLEITGRKCNSCNNFSHLLTCPSQYTFV